MDPKLVQYMRGAEAKHLLYPYYVLSQIFENFGEKTLREIAPKLGRNMEIWEKFVAANRDVNKLVKNLLKDQK